MNLQRLLVDRMEHRIVVGTVAFLGIVVLVGWIAINEGGRMAAFDKQFTARSIERGAATFVTYCSECHGVDGRGSPRAPALNSPMLFGHDYLPDIHRERLALEAESRLEDTTDARKAEIDARLAELAQEEQAAIVPLQAAIDKGYNPDQFSRTVMLGWTSTLHNLLYTTVFSGRPVSGAYWPQSMPAWSQTAGGSLRNDQVEDVVQFILNWDKGDQWTVEDLLAIQQFPKIPGQEQTTAIEGAIGVDTSTEQIMAGLADLTGDPIHGGELYNSQGCFACHSNATVAPAFEGTWTRVETERLADPQFAGYTGEQYIAESVIHSQAYIVPAYGPLMPQDFGNKLTSQDLADLIAYLKTQDQPAS